MLPLAHSQHNDCQLSSFMALIKWDCQHTHTASKSEGSVNKRSYEMFIFISGKNRKFTAKTWTICKWRLCRFDIVSKLPCAMHCFAQASQSHCGCGILAAHGTSFNMGFRWRFLFLCMCAALAPAPAPNRCPRKVVSFNSHHFLEMFTSDSFNRSDCLTNFVNFAVAQPLIATKPNDNEYPFILTPHSMQMHIHGRCRLISRAKCRPKDTSTQ